MEYNITVKIVVNEQNPNVPTLEDCILAIENSIMTPDNDHWGIMDISVLPASDLSNSAILPSATEFEEVAAFAAKQMAQTIREDREKCLCADAPTVHCPVHGPGMYEVRR
ncbi:MAG: hypothetical protein ACHQX3_05960 [Nitrospirales bacterium]